MEDDRRRVETELIKAKHRLTAVEESSTNSTDAEATKLELEVGFGNSCLLKCSWDSELTLPRTNVLKQRILKVFSNLNKARFAMHDLCNQTWMVMLFLMLAQVAKLKEKCKKLLAERDKIAISSPEVSPSLGHLLEINNGLYNPFLTP